MATAELSELRGARAPSANQSKNVVAILADPKVKEQLALALPRHLSAERLARIALTEVRKNPKLAQCEGRSFLGAIMQCAQLGLEPGSALGHAYLVPFNNRKKGILECQFLLGYRGMLDLARRSGNIISISARAVHVGDEFDYCYGLSEDVKHRPGKDSNRQPITHVYAVAKLRDGGVQFEVMSREDVEAIRNASQGKDGEPWRLYWEEMAKKTVIRRLYKYLPISSEVLGLLRQDEAGEHGLPQLSVEALEGEYNVLNDDPDAFAQGQDQAYVVSDLDPGEAPGAFAEGDTPPLAGEAPQGEAAPRRPGRPRGSPNRKSAQAPDAEPTPPQHTNGAAAGAGFGSLE